MKVEKDKRTGRGLRKKFFKAIAVLLVIAVAASAVFVVYRNKRSAKASAELKLQTAVARRGDLNISITGSGPIASSSRTDIIPKTTGTVTKVYFKEGDTVKAGDLLYEIDDSTVRSNIDKLKTNIVQTQQTQDNNYSARDSLNVNAPFSGQVTGIQVKAGDTLAKNGAILTLTDTSRMKLSIPFNSSGIDEITPGKQVTVYIQNFNQAVPGTVSYVSNRSYSTASGGELYSVEVLLDNPGSLKDGMKASVEAATSKGPVYSTEMGTLSYVNNTVIKNENGGNILNVNVREYQYVNAGDPLVQLQNNDINQSIDSTDSKLKDYQSQLDAAVKDLENYRIYAPINGTIVKQSVNVGDSLKAAQSIATLADNSQMEFSVTIDELDIGKVKVGQKVNVTVDALSETAARPLSGEVSKVAIEGTYQNGVTTYPVTIKVLNPENLKVGMSANAEIFITSKQNVLLLPVQAVNKDRIGGKSYVIMKDDGTNSEGNIQNSSNAPQATGASGRANAGDGNARKRSGYGSQSTSGQSTSQAGSAQSSNQNSSTQNNGTQNANRNGNSILSSLIQNNEQYKKYYENTKVVEVEVGANNETYVEIVSGINEGDVVILPPVTLGQSSTNRTTTRTTTGGANRLGGMGAMFGGDGGRASVPSAAGGGRK